MLSADCKALISLSSRGFTYLSAKPLVCRISTSIKKALDYVNPALKREFRNGLTRLAEALAKWVALAGSMIPF